MKQQTQTTHDSLSNQANINLSNPMPPHFDIIIVGAGPAGLSFAKAIAQTGLQIAIVEKASEDSLANPPYDGREIALTHASKDLMQQLDIWQKIPNDEKHILKDASVYDGNSTYQLYFGKPKSVRGLAIEGLGYLVSNHLIRKACYEATKVCDNITLQCDSGVKNVQTASRFVTVTLDNLQTITANMLIVADSRFSQTRRQLGITADSHDFGRSMIVCRMSHTQSNQQRAVESFYYGVTVALLPMTEQMTNCVITVKNEQAEYLLGLSPTAFAKEIEGYIDGSLGEMRLISSQHRYPLVGVHANRFYANRSAVIGDAAVGMHPVTAHGFNLGLHSVAVLSKLIKQAVANQSDIASPELLAKYQRQHMLLTRPMYHGTNAMVTLFTTENKPAKAIRSLVLRVSNNLPPLKSLITKQLTG